MEIIASAIFGRSSFTFGRSRMIRFTCRQARCPLNRIYKHALELLRCDGCLKQRQLFAKRWIRFSALLGTWGGEITSAGLPL
jgi:hypothetical protein